MMEFDLQRFDDENEAASAESSSAEQSSEESKALPEELNGLPEDIARETLAEWEASQAEEQPETQTESGTQPETDTDSKPGAVPYDRFKEKVDEANKLKAQLEEYRQLLIQRQQQQQPQPQKQPPRPPQPTITPEFSKQVNKAIEEEALALTGFSKDAVKEIEYATEDDPRVAQWEQAKTFATYNVINALKQRQAAQQQQQQQFLSEHAQAAQAFNAYVEQTSAEPDFREVQKFAVNDFFSQLPQNAKQTLAMSYLRVSRNVASPAEMMVVTNFFENAKAAYRARTQRAKKTAQGQQPQPKPTMPRTNQVKGTAATNDGQLSERDIEKMLEGDFTEIDPQTQNILLALS